MITKGTVDGIITSKSISVDEFGIVSQSITETINKTNTTSANIYQQSDFMVLGEASPDFNKLLCTDVSLNDSGPVKTITKTYKGALVDTVRLRLSAQGTQEPIQTHPAFNDTPAGFNGKIAGTGADPENGAKFKGKTEDSEFDYFPANADNNLGGVTGYLNPTLELEKITVKTNTDMSDPTWITDDIYKIADIVDPDLNLSIGQRNWLLMGSTQEVIGGAIKSTAIYRMSGDKGWNNMIYTEA
jgi:hypothetical protein